MSKIDSLEQLYGLFGDLIPKKLFERSEKGVKGRERCLPPRVIFWAFVAQVLDPGTSCRGAVRKVEAWWRWSQKERGENSLSTSAYCQARARLPMDLLRGAHEALGRWIAQRTRSAWLCRVAASGYSMARG